MYSILHHRSVLITSSKTSTNYTQYIRQMTLGHDHTHFSISPSHHPPLLPLCLHSYSNVSLDCLYLSFLFSHLRMPDALSFILTLYFLLLILFLSLLLPILANIPWLPRLSFFHFLTFLFLKYEYSQLVLPQTPFLKHFPPQYFHLPSPSHSRPS